MWGRCVGLVKGGGVVVRIAVCVRRGRVQFGC